jgi:hypothetical protein
MKRWGFLALAAAIVAVALPVSAQQQRGRGLGGGQNALSLLTQKSVQEELKLSEDQIKKATELQEKMRGSFNFKDLKDKGREEIQKALEERAKESDKAAAEILKPEQLKRVKQIVLQLRGSQAFADSAVVEELKLTAEQKEKIQAIQKEAAESTRSLFQGGANEETRKKVEELRKATTEKVTALLSDEQKSKWKERTGEPFKGEIVRRRLQTN